MGKKSTRRATPGKRGDMPHTVAKTYKVHADTVKAIEKIAPGYGSLGRMLQVATELLIRMPKPLKLIEPERPDKVIGKTYKLTPRTVELIEELARSHYQKRGKVLAACAEILKPS
jgi:hypothetical protein